MDAPNKKEENEVGNELSLIRPSSIMKWVEWAEKRALVVIVIWAFTLLYKKDQELSSLNREFMRYLMEEKKAVNLSIQDKQDVIKKMSNDEVR